MRLIIESFVVSKYLVTALTPWHRSLCFDLVSVICFYSCMKAGFTFLLLGASIAPLTAATYLYQIDGVVTNAPNVPNVFPEGPQWDFTNNPFTFSGTFEADDTWVGPIANFQLKIGGVDVSTFHPENDIATLNGGSGVDTNFFDPTTNALRWAGIDTNFFTSFISIGQTAQTSPPDRIVAIQFTDPQILPPGDPIYVATVNWEGTFGVTKTSQVPESGSTFAIASLGLGGFLLLNALTGRKKRV